MLSAKEVAYEVTKALDMKKGMNIKLLEGERCQNPIGQMDCDALAEGIEVDKNHAPVAYHFTQKPVWSFDNYTNFVDSVRVPAFDAFGNPNVIHVFTSDRTDQRRGVPLLAPVICQLKQQERYQDAELMAAVISACFTRPIQRSQVMPCCHCTVPCSTSTPSAACA